MRRSILKWVIQEGSHPYVMFLEQNATMVARLFQPMFSSVMCLFSP